MKKFPKLIILIILLGVLFLGVWQIVQAHGLLIEYPQIPGASKPGTGGAGEGETTSLPEIIKYIYMFSLGICGVIALLFMLIGAIRYIFSAGNPSKAGDAKDQIFSAILGIIILLASVLILRTINPDLVNIGFKLPEIKGAPPGGGTRSEYPITQCYASRNAQCTGGKNLYRSCEVQSFTTNEKEAENACMEICTNQVRQLPGGGAPQCSVYWYESLCQPTGCH